WRSNWLALRRGWFTDATAPDDAFGRRCGRCGGPWIGGVIGDGWPPLGHDHRAAGEHVVQRSAARGEDQHQGGDWQDGGGSQPEEEASGGPHPVDAPTVRVHYPDAGGEHTERALER